MKSKKQYRMESEIMSSVITGIDQLPTDSSQPFQTVGAELSSVNDVRKSLSQLKLKTIAIAVMTLWIGCVSTYDVYCSFKTQKVLLDYERNPVGVWLIEMDGGDIALFMTCKMLGTMVVLISIPALFFFRKSWGLTIGITISLFQLWLFCFLNS